jgi:sn-glycerol 3-phosphate transport system substrate-binding protein
MPAIYNRHMRIVRLMLAGAALLAASVSSFAATELQLWHSLEGAGAAELERIAESFNASQADYRVVPSYKGGSRDALAAAVAAQRSGQGPHVVQVDDNAVPLAEESPRSFAPLYQVMAEAGMPLRTSTFVSALEERFTDDRGRLLSLPFNASTPVLYYNRDVFKAAGLDPEKPPRTWAEVQAAALQILDTAAAPCAYTTDAPGWVHMENVLSQHNEPLSSGQGAASRLVFNGHLLVLHVGMLSSWVSSGLFNYFGGGEAEQRFASGECGMLTGASNSVADIQRKAEFRVAMAALPVHADRPMTDTLVPRSGSLWITAGKKKAEYAGVAKFFAFLSKPEIQAQWHQATGFLPTTVAGFELTRKQGYYDRHPGADIPMHGMHAMKGTHRHAGPRFAHMLTTARLRPILDEELEAVWGKRSKTPKEALDDAVERGNKLLKTAAPVKAAAPRKAR